MLNRFKLQRLVGLDHRIYIDCFFGTLSIYLKHIHVKYHSCSEVRGVVARDYTHSNCDYGPSKVMPSVEPMGHFNRRPLLVHGLALSALDTRVELPDRDAEHPKDAPLLEYVPSGTSKQEQWRLCYPRLARDPTR